ncbi:MAG TPA: hypothetical protein VFL47_03650, partial [Flavisolibacter sp.]|nr:hypothetical protein [Flavisolibacter sp.]
TTGQEQKPGREDRQSLNIGVLKFKTINLFDRKRFCATPIAILVFFVSLDSCQRLKSIIF